MKVVKRFFALLMATTILTIQCVPAFAAPEISHNKFWGYDISKSSLISSSGSELKVTDTSGAITYVFSKNSSTGNAKIDYSPTKVAFDLSTINTGTSDFNALISIRFNNVLGSVWDATSNSISLQINPANVILKRVANGITQEYDVLYKSFVDGYIHSYEIAIDDISKTVTAIIDRNDANKIEISCAVLPASGGYQIIAMKSTLTVRDFIPSVNPFQYWANDSAFNSYMTYSGDNIKVTDPNSSTTRIFATSQYSTSPKIDYTSNHSTFKLSATNNSGTDFNMCLSYRMNDPTSAIWVAGINSISLLIYPNAVLLERIANGVVVESNTLNKSFVDGNVHNYDVTIDDSTNKVIVIIDGSINNKLEITCASLPSSGGTQIMAYRSVLLVSGFINDLSDATAMRNYNVSTFNSPPSWGTHSSMQSLVNITSTSLQLIENNGSQTSAFTVLDANPRQDYTTKHTSFTMSATNTGTTDWNVIFSMRFNNILSAVWDANSNALSVILYPNSVQLKRIDNTVQMETVTLNTGFADGNEHTYDFFVDEYNEKVTLIIDNNQNYKLQLNCTDIPAFGGMQFMTMKSTAIITNMVHEVYTNDKAGYEEGMTAKIYGKDSNNDKIIANVNVKDSPYNAFGNGVDDDTYAIQSALDDMNAGGGGIVFIPKGKYVVKGNLEIPKNCVLRGEWDAPDNGGNGKGTILMAYADRNNESGKGFITMNVASCLKNISVWYPEQYPDSIVPYPWTVEFANVSCMIDGLTLYNSYKGVNTWKTNGSAQHVFKVYGTPLKIGISMDVNLEVSECSTVRFSVDIWANSGLTGAPNSTQLANVRITTRSGAGIECGRIDDVWLYDIGINPYDYPRGIKFYQGTGLGNPNLAGGTYGHMMNLHKTQIEILGLSTLGPNLDIVDDQTTMPTPPIYNYAVPRGAVSDTLIVSVKDFGATGDGISDDQTAFNNALSAVSDSKGTVFVPAGKYKISGTLTIPIGVELRGVFEGPHSCMAANVSELLAYSGRGGTTGTSFISLSADSGIHGLTIRYPEQDPANIVAYPYTVKGNGSNVWVEATTFINSYMGIDFGNVRCDNFLIKNVWGTIFKEGFNIGAGSTNGVLENTLISYGIWYETDGLSTTPEIATAMINYYKANAVNYYLGDVNGMIGWSVFCFGSKDGVKSWEQNNQVPRNINFYRLGLDMPNTTGQTLNLPYANTINIYGVSLGAPATKGFRDASTTIGPVNLWGANMWAGCTNLIVKPSVDKVYMSTNPNNSPRKTTVIPSTNSSGELWATAYPTLVTITDTQVNLTENNGLWTSIYSLDGYAGTMKANYSTKHLSYTLSATNKGTSDWNSIMTFRMSKPVSAVWDETVNSISVQVNPTNVILKRSENGVLKESQILYVSFTDGVNHNYDVTVDDTTKKVALIIDNNQAYKLEITCASLITYGGFNLMAMKSDVVLTNFVNEVGANLN